MSKKTQNIIVAILLLIPVVLVTNTLDSDVWFQLNHGRYLLSEGFTDIEPFTLHEGLSFSFEKWLTCILFWKIYELFGAQGLYILVAVVTYLTGLLLYKLCMQASRNWKVSLINTVLIMIPYVYNFSRTRPQIFSCALMLIEVLLLEKWVETKKNAYLIGIPFLSLVYMQLHSTMWPMFFIMMMPYLFDFRFITFNRIEGQDSNKLPLLLTFFASIGAGFINPYGFDSVVYLIKSLSGNFAYQIAELSRTTYASIIRLSMVIVPHIIFMIFTSKKLPLRYVYFIGGTTLMMLVAVRNQAFYLLFAGFITAYMYKDVEIEFKYLDKLLIAGCCCTIVLSIANGYWRMFIRDANKSTTQMNVVNQLVEMDPRDDITMYTSFGDGAYPEFMGIKAYIDARAEVFIPEINEKEDILLEYNNLIHGLIHYSDLQEKYNFDYWMVEQDSFLDVYLGKDPAYRIVIEDEYYKIYSCTR